MRNGIREVGKATGTAGQGRASLRNGAVAFLVVVLLGAFVSFWLRREPTDAPRPGSHASRSLTPRGEPAGRGAAPHERASTSATGTVRTTEGRPIARAAVCAVGVYAMPLGMAKNPCVETDGRGAFVLGRLAPGSYFVRASARGYAPGVASGGHAVTLAPGEARNALDIALDAGGATLSGTVIDATGGAVARAVVRAARAKGPGDMIDVVADDQGRFEASVAPGVFAVTAQASGYSRAYVFATAPSSNLVVVLTPEGTISGKVVMADDGRVVEGVRVSARLASGIGLPSDAASTGPDGEFTVSGLLPGAYSLTAEGDHLHGSAEGPFEVDVAEGVEGAVISLNPAIRLAGRVVDRDTKLPCTAGTVSLDQAEDSTTPVPSMTTAIEATGEVEFGSVPSGRYAARINCANHVLVSGPQVLDVARDDVAGLEWKVAPGLGISVLVVDAKDRPLAGASFMVQVPQEPGEAPAFMSGMSDAEGRYEFSTVLAPGRYEISPAGNFHGDPVAVELKEGMGKVAATLRLRGSASITVSVRTQSGDPVEGVAVVALSLDEPIPALPGLDRLAARDKAGPAALPGVSESEATAARDTFLRRATVARQASVLGGGRYRVGPLEPGTYEVSVEDGVNAPALAGGTARTTLTVRDGAEATATVVFDRGGSVSGRVLDDAGGPRPNAWVSAVDDTGNAAQRALRTAAMFARKPGPGQRVLTDLDGRFRLENLAPGGVFEVRAEELRGGITVKNGVHAGDEVTLRFSATGSLRGTALAATGKPVPATSIQVTDPATGWMRSQFVNPDGSWEFASVPSGRLRLNAMDATSFAAKQEVDVAPHQAVDSIHLVLEGERAAAAPAAEEDRPL